VSAYERLFNEERLVFIEIPLSQKEIGPTDEKVKGLPEKRE